MIFPLSQILSRLTDVPADVLCHSAELSLHYCLYTALWPVCPILLLFSETVSHYRHLHIHTHSDFPKEGPSF